MPTSYVKPVKMGSGVDPLPSAVVVYTTPVSSVVECAVLKEVWVMNTGVNSKQFALLLTPTSGSPVTVYKITLRVGEGRLSEHSTVLEPGDALSVVSDAVASNLEYRLSGLEYQVLP